MKEKQLAHFKDKTSLNDSLVEELETEQNIEFEAL